MNDDEPLNWPSVDNSLSLPLCFANDWPGQCPIDGLMKHSLATPTSFTLGRSDKKIPSSHSWIISIVVVIFSWSRTGRVSFLSI